MIALTDEVYIRVLKHRDNVKARKLSSDGLYSFHLYRPSHGTLKDKMFETTITIVARGM